MGLAAATQLDLGWAGNFQAGAVTVDADCQTSEITTKFTDPEFANSADIPWDVDGVEFTGIDSACSGMSFEATYRTGSGEWSAPATGTVSGSVIDFQVPAGVDVQKIDEFALTIYGG